MSPSMPEDSVMSSPWEPASIVCREEVLKLHHEVAARPSFPTLIYEDVFRIQALEMDWDIGVTIYEPQDSAAIPTGPDGKKVGVFSSPWRCFRLQICRACCANLGRKIRHQGHQHDFPRKVLFARSQERLAR